MKSNKYMLTAGLLISSAIGVMGGCAATQKAAAPEATQSAPARIEPAQAVLKGKVVETMNAGPYSYVLLENDGKKVWAAMPAMTTIKVGDYMELQPGAEMKNFTSQSLKKTFDSVIFSGGPISKEETAPAGKSATMPPGHPGMEPKAASTLPVTGSKPAKEITPSVIVLAGKVMETKNVGVYTYILLEKDGKRGWSAVPATPVKVGDDIEILPGLEMGLYTSPSTNETFANIYFSSGVKGIAPTSAVPAMQPNSMPSGHPALPTK